MSHHEPIDFTFDSPQEIGYQQNTGGSSNGGESIWAAIIGFLSDLFQGWSNRRAQRRENEKDRKFNAEQAELSRQWQEEQYKKYESVAAQMQQRQAAGLNPNDQIQAMSVGSGSTASSSSHSLPPISADFSLISQIPSMLANLQLTKAETENIKQKTATERVEGMRKAVELDDYMAFREYYLEGVKYETNTKKHNMEKAEADARKAFDEARIAHVNANNAEGAEASGVNPIIDESNYKQAQTALANATANLTDANRQSVEFALQLSKKFDEQFLNLSLSERQQQVKEFLDQAPIRASLAQFAKTLQENATQISNREVALNEVQSRIVRDMLLAVESNLTSDNIIDNIQSVIAFSYVTNPSATISAITNLIPDLSIKNNNSKTTHTHYDTGTRFTTINN